MSEHGVTIDWQVKAQASAGDDFQSGRYLRRFEVTYDGGAVVMGSASPDVVPVPLSDASAVDPEEMFVAGLSSCHMLWFVDLARRAGIIIDRYQDDPIGHMTRESAGDKQGGLWMSSVILRPLVTTSKQTPLDGDLLADLHRRAHDACFLARSVKTVITVKHRSA